MRTRLLSVLVLLCFICLAEAASAASWSAVRVPSDSGLSAISCTSKQWCEAVGGWRQRLTAARWNGSRWVRQPAPASPRGAKFSTLDAIDCPSKRSCVAVGEYFKHAVSPAMPLIERWTGSRWRVEHAPSAPPPAGYRYASSRLKSVRCTSSTLCFAVGQAVAFGAGNATGVALIERWNGRRWNRVQSPGAAGPLTSVSCTSAHACTAVGGFAQVVGTPSANNQQEIDTSTIQRWSGRTWSPQSLPAPPGAGAAIALGVSCTSATDCMAVGRAASSQGAQGASSRLDQALVADWHTAAWSTNALSYPPDVYRSPSTQNPQTALNAIACQTSAWCAAVGTYVASNGAIGPLAAVWNGSTWTQTVLRRGPAALESIACPGLGWCMAVDGTIAERFRG